MISWRRESQPNPVFLPGEFHGERNLAGYSLWGCKESDTTKQLTHIYTPEAIKIYLYTILWLPRRHSGKAFACQCRRHKTCGFSPWVRKVPWRRKWHPILLFLPRKFHRERSPVSTILGVSESQTQQSMHMHRRTVFMYDSIRACMLIHFDRVQLFTTSWIIAHQIPQSMEFSKQEYWSGLPFPPPYYSIFICYINIKEKGRRYAASLGKNKPQ